MQCTLVGLCGLRARVSVRISVLLGPTLVFASAEGFGIRLLCAVDRKTLRLRPCRFREFQWRLQFCQSPSFAIRCNGPPQLRSLSSQTRQFGLNAPLRVSTWVDMHTIVFPRWLTDHKKHCALSAVGGAMFIFGSPVAPGVYGHDQLHARN